MGANSTIEWTHHTFNPWRGCAKVSPGCANCYAETLSRRNPASLGVWGANGTRVVAAESAWREPIKWDAAARKAGQRHRVFCASLADVFEDWQGHLVVADGRRLWVNESGKVERQALPGQSDRFFFDIGYRPMILDDVRRRLFWLIDATPNLDWLLLTKRPENIERLMAGRMNQEGPRPNVWLGTSVENQEQADARIPHLLKAPAAVRFLSCEPLLGSVKLPPVFLQQIQGTSQSGQRFIDWVIVGGESGPGARPMHPDWARSLRDQCQAAGVPFHFKQWGEWLPHNQKQYRGAHYSVRGHKFDDDNLASRVGKKAAGRMLDGREWSEVPGVQR